MCCIGIRNRVQWSNQLALRFRYDCTCSGRCTCTLSLSSLVLHLWRVGLFYPLILAMDAGRSVWCWIASLGWSQASLWACLVLQWRCLPSVSTCLWESRSATLPYFKPWRGLCRTALQRELLLLTRYQHPDCSLCSLEFLERCRLESHIIRAWFDPQRFALRLRSQQS